MVITVLTPILLPFPPASNTTETLLSLTLTTSDSDSFTCSCRNKKTHLSNILKGIQSNPIEWNGKRSLLGRWEVQQNIENLMNFSSLNIVEEDLT